MFIALGYADFPLIAAVLLSASFAPLVFAGGFNLVLAGMVLWGIGVGAQESVLKAEIAEMVPPERRGTAFGTFHTAFGICWFAGSLLMVRMYDSSILSLIIFSVTSQIVALAVISYLILKKNPIR